MSNGFLEKRRLNRKKQREERIEKENFKFLERKKEVTSIFFRKKNELESQCSFGSQHLTSQVSTVRCDWNS